MSITSGKVEIRLEAIDQATPSLGKVEREVGSLTQGLGKAESQVQSLGKVSTVSLKDVVTGFSGVATAGFALYGTYERIEDASIALDTAEKNVHRTETTLMSLRKRLNDLTAQGKTETEDYRITTEKLSVAEQTLEIQIKKLQQAKEDLNKSYALAATSIVPSLITAGMSLKDVYGTLKTYTERATTAQLGLNAAMWAAPLGIIAGLAANVAMSSQNYQQRLAALNEEQRRFFDAAVARMPETEHAGSAMYFTLLEEAEKYKAGVSDSGYVDAILRQTKSMVDGINKEFQTGLLGTAQGKVKSFTECVVGKTEGMADQVAKATGSMMTEQEEIMRKGAREALGLPYAMVTTEQKKGAWQARTGLSELRDLEKGLPKGEYLLSKHSPAVASPLIPGFGIMPKGWRPTPTPTGIPGFGGPRPITAIPREAPTPPVSITANVSSTVNIAGPVEPGMVPAITEEVKRSAYEGTSSALRDSLRRKGVRRVG